MTGRSRLGSWDTRKSSVGGVTCSYCAAVILTDTEIGDLLGPAGLRLVERVQQEVRLPLPKYVSPASARPEHGRFDCPDPDEVADLDAPDFADTVNAGWHRLATEYGLLDDQREFLLAVGRARLGEDSDDELYEVWFRVQLLDEWDLVGSEVDLLRSGFATSSLIASFRNSRWLPWTAG